MGEGEGSVPPIDRLAMRSRSGSPSSSGFGAMLGGEDGERAGKRKR